VFIEATDISAGDERLNLLFLAAIFNHCHGIYLANDGYDDDDDEEEDDDAVNNGGGVSKRRGRGGGGDSSSSIDEEYAGMTAEEFQRRIDELLGPSAVKVRMEMDEAKLRDDGGGDGSEELSSRYVEESAEVRREEEVFRMWINSRKFSDLQITNLFSDMEDGVSLLRLIDHVEPGAIDWKRCVRSYLYVCTYGLLRIA
jgi:hypothetical protein